jgi:beta-alanine--pyruvate transaminase
LRGLPNVIDLRNIGIVGAVEPRVAPRGRAASRPSSSASKRSVLVRSTADTIALSPPLIVERDQITRMFEVLAGVLRRVA